MMGRWRCLGSAWLAAWCLTLLAGQPCSAATPNVLVILADDLGFSDIGCYGSEIATPNLDSLAAGGLRYTQFYNTARCWPTRGALLTGYYAQQIHRDALPKGQGGARGKRPAWAQLLPQMLKPLGYRSYISGKWHVDGKPTEQGFDHSYVIEDHDRFHNPKRHSEDDKPLPPVQPDSGFYLTTAIADHAIKCLKEHAEDHAGKPFFHYLAFTSPHFPLQALPQDIAKYASRYTEGWDSIRQKRYDRQRAMHLVKCPLAPLESAIGPPYSFPDAIKQLGPGEVIRELPWSELTDEQRKFQAAKMAVHAAMVDRMDQEIGRVLQQLKTMGAFDDTLVLFFSDNGASAEIMIRGDGHDPNAPIGSAASFVCLGPGWSRSSNTPFRRHKTWVHEGGISTPLIAHWPRGIAAHGQLHSRLGHVVDIAPTIVQLAGGKWPEQVGDEKVPATPGQSLVDSFHLADAQRQSSLWWLHEGNRALRSGNWKAVAAKDEQWQLYDLSKDRSETHNLADQEPETLKRLVAEWEATTQQIAKDSQ
ncbi:MAG: arylsulfatase [Aureliella sp.]